MLNFSDGTMAHLAGLLLGQEPVHVGEWQSTDVSASPVHATYELTDMVFMIDVPASDVDLATTLGKDLNLVWAEEHFQERVSGVPLNPPPSHERWPWARHNGNHQNGEQKAFSHSYPERFWPKFGNEGQTRPNGRQVFVPHNGIRYEFGDLADVLDLLVRSPLTRQAYLPVWFPEDTGTVHGMRVPCTLGYHFMIRDGVMSMRYYMRSCDLVRHFTDDVYLAGRLLQWMVDAFNHETNGSVKAGRMTMYIASLHAFVGDKFKLDQMVARAGVVVA